jgi:hypothetical protein
MSATMRGQTPSNSLSVVGITLSLCSRYQKLDVEGRENRGKQDGEKSLAGSISHAGLNVGQTWSGFPFNDTVHALTEI